MPEAERWSAVLSLVLSLIPGVAWDKQVDLGFPFSKINTDFPHLAHRATVRVWREHGCEEDFQLSLALWVQEVIVLIL